MKVPNPPAFPIDRNSVHGILAHTGMPEGEAAYISALAEMSAGMTLRDYFAAKVIAVLVVSPLRQELTTEQDVNYAYKVADDMLKRRLK